MDGAIGTGTVAPMELISTETGAEPAWAAFVGTPLTVVFAEAESIEQVRRAGEGVLPLEPPYHVSDDDAYLVLPDDIGVEIVDILRDGDQELLADAVREGLLVLGAVLRKGRGVVELHVEEAVTPADALAAGMEYGASVEVGGGDDPVRAANELGHVQCTMVSALLDDEGLERILRAEEHVGTSWRVPPHAADRLVGVEPTYAWSRRLAPGRVGIELALFSEEEELVAVVRPVELVAA